MLRKMQTKKHFAKAWQFRYQGVIQGAEGGGLRSYSFVSSTVRKIQARRSTSEEPVDLENIAESTIKKQLQRGL